MASLPVLTERASESQERERAELAAVLECEFFRRSPQISRLLSYLCEKYFEGRANEIKEYTIAVDVLGRGTEFDPQIDAIVRVDAYHLRKRLKQYYASDGMDHEIQLVLPAGQYTPKFISRTETDVPAPAEIAPAEQPPSAVTAVMVPEPLPPTAPLQLPQPARAWLMPGLALAIVLAAAAVLWFVRPNANPDAKRPADTPTGAVAAKPATPELAPVLADNDEGAIRIMAGDRKTNYVDKAGHLWLPDRYFTGGTPFRRVPIEIRRTQDPLLFENGREGGFAYKIPLQPGTYDLRLYFAETWFKGEALRSVNVAVNGLQASSFDIISDAGGVDTATTKVFRNVSPGKDGTLDLIFQGSRENPSFLNAIEILPGVAGSVPGKMRPIRLTTGEHPYQDKTGHFWLPDESAYGGRRSTRSTPMEGTVDPGLYQNQRFGHFTYSIPVAEGGHYTVVLHFAETWFGTSNAPGGPGSRVFDVYCNGTTLLKEFDILREGASNRVLIKTFHGIPASPQGKLNLEFTPRVNYALINAIEIVEE
jgi:hypothetical protein